MSIATVMTAIGGFLSGPVMTGISNLATLGTLGVSIATKVDTSNMKGTLSGIRSDIMTLDNDILTLTGDVEDFRKENRWNVALSGGTPLKITGGAPPQIVQLVAPTQQPQAVQQVMQPVPQPAPQVQPVQPVQQQVAPQAQYITKDEINTVLNNFTNSIPTMVARAIQQAQAMTPTVANPTPANPTPAPAPEAKPDTKSDIK
jgi:hypothetical protein